MAWFLTIGTSESQNPSANQSTVSATLYLNWNGGSAYANYTQEWYINIGGNVTGGAAPTAVNYNPNTGSYVSLTGSVAVGSYSVTFTHDTNGYRGTVGTSGSFDGDGGFGPGDISVGGPTYGAIDYVRLPSAPASVTAVSVGPVITVTAGEASTPGPTITAYKVSYASSTNGGATWSSWSSETNMTNRVYSYNSLTPGLTYKFRVRATNSDGDGPFTESNTLFLTAGGKRYTGTNWALTAAAAKRFNGTSFVSLTTAKRYNGSAWVNLS
jgi:hypothetical protein